MAPALDLPISSGWLTALAFVACAGVFYLRSPTHQLRHIPTVGGSSLPGLSHLSGFRFIRHAKETLQEGYEKYNGRIFKVALLDRWLVVVTGPQLMGEVQGIPDAIMSFDRVVDENFAGKYTFGPNVMDDAWHIEILKRKLTKHLGVLFPAIREEIAAGFDEYAPVTDDWTPVPVLKASTRVVARASNRIFVGAPLCRDLAYLEICIGFTRALIVARLLLGWFPKFLKPLVATYMSPIPPSIRKATDFMMPAIEQRRALVAEQSTELPMDILSWMVEHTKNDPVRGAARSLVIRLLALNFAAIHTSSLTFTHALYTLAANPEYIAPLREEAEAIAAAEGLTKTSLLKLTKLDSFLRESTRVNTFNGLALMRLVLVPYTFGDGTVVPPGTMVASPTWCHHLDGGLYDDPRSFDPWRFVPATGAAGEAEAEEESEKAPARERESRKAFTTTDLQYIPFGHGRHACPGRFFAGTELKTMLVHVLLTYDLKAAVDGVRPKDVPLGQSSMPDPDGIVLFRRRQT